MRDEAVVLDDFAVAEVVVDFNLNVFGAGVFGAFEGVDGAAGEEELGVVAADEAVLGGGEATAGGAEALVGVVAEGDEDGAAQRHALVEQHTGFGELAAVVDLGGGGDFEAEDFGGVAVA